MRYFAGSALFHYLGPSFAVLLFARVDVLGVAWMRIAAAAAVFALWRQPWHEFDRIVVALGCVLAVMNACFYLAIDRLPLATVAAIEFIGPGVLALIGVRSLRNVAAVASSVIPYVLDQMAMARLERATYALFVALLPAFAVVIGALVLTQIPSRADAAGIALVMTAVGVHQA